jgi:transcriptional regulator with XRE-family HTH domain
VVVQPLLDPSALKAERTLKRLSQAKLAADAGISVGYIGMIELGQRNPRAEVIRRLADALGVPVRRITVPEPKPGKAKAQREVEASSD